MKVARLYLRVSTDEQDLTRQVDIEHSTRAAGYQALNQRSCHQVQLANRKLEIGADF